MEDFIGCREYTWQWLAWNLLYTQFRLDSVSIKSIHANLQMTAKVFNLIKFYPILKGTDGKEQRGRHAVQLCISWRSYSTCVHECVCVRQRVMRRDSLKSMYGLIAMWPRWEQWTLACQRSGIAFSDWLAWEKMYNYSQHPCHWPSYSASCIHASHVQTQAQTQAQNCPENMAVF